MFSARPVSLYNVLVVKEAFSLLTKKILNFGAVHVEEKLSLVNLEGLSSFESKSLLSRLDSIALRVESQGKLLGLSLEKLEKTEVDPFLQFPDDGLDFEKGISALEDRIKNWEHLITNTAMLLEEKKDFIFLHEQISWVFSLLIHSGIESLYELDDTFLAWEFGNIPKDNIAALQHALAEVPFSMEYVNISRNRCALFIVTLPQYRKNLTSALHAAGFIPVELPKISATSMLSDFEEDMEFALWEARDEIAQVRQQLKELAIEYYPMLGGMLKLVRMYQHVLNSLAQVKATDSAIALNVWVLDENAVDFENLIASSFKNLAFYERKKAEETGVEYKDIPAKFNVPKMFKPFFSIVKMFGYPSYDEINPVIFVFINMVVMFGIMFADVGHGFVLLLIGLILLKKTIDIAAIFIPLGISSIFFGFIFGSIFGIEGIVHPIWTLPLENPIAVIALAIGIGVIDLTVAILLNLILSIKRKDRETFLLGQWGIFGLLSYIFMLFFFMPVMQELKWLKLILFLSVLFAPVVIETIKEKRHGRPIDISMIIFHPFETFLSLFSNTISYVRIAAFTFNHAALMMVVFVLADMISLGGRLSIIKIAILILGNVFVIGLETVLSSIQCLRLNYYEFFTKFYQGRGRKFEALKWV